jgi:hypothetical protein
LVLKIILLSEKKKAPFVPWPWGLGLIFGSANFFYYEYFIARNKQYR